MVVSTQKEKQMQEEPVNVVLVEDNDFVRATLKDYLSDCGMYVADTAAPDVALSLLHEISWPAVLVTDINLGCDVDGFGLAVTARQTHPSLPVVYMTGFESNFQKRRPGSADRFMSKPFPLAALLSAIYDIAGN
jgi:CheY-like chemotaxis protein